MISCSGCGHKNRQGIFYCEECASPLLTSKPQATIPLANIRERLAAKMAQGSGRFEADFQLVIYVQNAIEPIRLSPGKRLILGRESRHNGHQPDVDLTCYDALRKGVSKIHAAITYQDNGLTITDLSSRNGTYLNEERLPANKGHILHDGDEIRLGKLVLDVYFQAQARYA